MGNPFTGNFERNTKHYCRVSKLTKDDSGNDAVYILSGSKDNIEKSNFIEGLLVNIEPFSETFEGKPTEKIRFTLRTPKSDDVAILSCGRYTAFTRDVLNCLANIPSIEHIRFTPFVSQAPELKQTFVHGAIRHNNEKVKKKYALDTIPKAYPKMITEIKKEILVTAERDEWYDKLIPEILSKLVYSEKISFSEQDTQDYQSISADNDELVNDGQTSADWDDVPY